MLLTKFIRICSWAPPPPYFTFTDLILEPHECALVTLSKKNYSHLILKKILFYGQVRPL